MLRLHDGRTDACMPNSCNYKRLAQIITVIGLSKIMRNSDLFLNLSLSLPQLLLQFRADSNATDNDGNKPLDLARCYERVDERIVELIQGICTSMRLL